MFRLIASRPALVCGGVLRSVARLRPAEIHGKPFVTAGRLASQGGVQASLAKLKKSDLVNAARRDPIFEKWLET